jgi:hypothetical protein
MSFAGYFGLRVYCGPNARWQEDVGCSNVFDTYELQLIKLERFVGDGEGGIAA